MDLKKPPAPNDLPQHANIQAAMDLKKTTCTK
jgi:hypothetical protein